ncbi:MAG: hypothetical protein SGBAC_000729 [Bacillariaceae sp.]
MITGVTTTDTIKPTPSNIKVLKESVARHLVPKAPLKLHPDMKKVNGSKISTPDSCKDVQSSHHHVEKARLERKRSSPESHGTQPFAKKPRESEAETLKKMTDACKTILECIGEDPDREGLQKTPTRWAKALLFMTQGYCQSCEEVTNGAVFSENHNEMVLVRNIDIHSLCEHHMVPFSGKIHIGYIPNGKVIGLSKLARIAEVYARRLQVQERLTREVAEAIVETVEPLGVMVVMECSHMCMVMRGVQKVGASTFTYSARGCFESDAAKRTEFFNIIANNGMRSC